MDWEKMLYPVDEKPLDRLVQGYSNTSIFRTMAFVGDSLSSGEFETRDKDGNPGWHDLYEYSWGQYIARNNGLKAYNFSRGGMTAAEYLDSFAEANGFWDQAKACQAYVIALGVNDVYNMHTPVGTMDDVDVLDYTKNNPETFIGRYATIVSRYKEISPDAKFFFVTFPKEDPAYPETEEVIQALYALAERFENAYVIDLYQYGPLYDDRFREQYYLYDHMNPSGYILTAQLVDSYIDYIVRHNPKDFDIVGFIGTDIPYK